MERCDLRDLGDLVSDNEIQVGEVALNNNKKLLAALNDASGEIDAALLVGGRYTPEELKNLTGYAVFHLIRITCDIAIARILGRRPRDVEQIKARVEMAEAHLESLRTGANVFNLAPQIAAANPSATSLTVVEYQQSQSIRDQTRHYYPARPIRPTG